MMDPYWNPAVEDQAVDRIVCRSLFVRPGSHQLAYRPYFLTSQHRLGQKRPVIAYKFIIQGSMEDRMLEIQDKKKKLASMSLSQTMSKKELHERRMEELKVRSGLTLPLHGRFDC
jgi:SWI/SNF-related matrix-associated actin-dependent regulator of chromatin subfamily A3